MSLNPTFTALAPCWRRELGMDWVMTTVTGDGSVVTGLGGAAGFGEIMLTRADDASLRVDTSAVFEGGFQFGAQHYSGNDLFVSTNGLVSFGAAINGVMSQLSAITHPFIAAFHADVDTRLDGEGAESGPIWVDVDPTQDIVTITWAEVGFYRRNASHTNTFQLQLYDQGEDGISIVLRYESIGWTSGDLQNGWEGLGGDPALIGWRLASTGAISTHWASGDEGRLLDLPGTLGNTGVQGLWVYTYRPPAVVNGTTASEVLVGNPGDDLLYGGEGDDRLAGLGGADALFGGTGFDLADYAQASGSVTANLVNSALNTGPDVFGDTFNGVEGLVGSSFADRLTGDAAANLLEGGAGNDGLSDGAGDDTVYGGDGDDSLIAGAGADRIFGGQGFDRVDYGTVPMALRIDLAQPSASTGFAAGDILDGVEVVSGSAFGDTILGDGATNRIYGAGGADYLYGRDGNDDLQGGTGDDRLVGGLGADRLNGGAGIDLAAYSTATSAVIADLLTPERNQGPDAVGDLYLGIEGLIGSAYQDRLHGEQNSNRLYGQNGNDWLDGRAGNDQLYGGDGRDTLIGGAGADLLQGGGDRDLVSYATAASGVTAHLSQPSRNTSEALGDSYSGIEDLLGSAWADVLTGNTLANVLSGGTGNDLLEGGSGADSLYGGTGLDLANYAEARSAVLVDLSAPWRNTHDAYGDRFFAIEGLRGSPYNDNLTGNAAANLLQGGGGNDSLYGGSSDDTLQGHSGGDYLYGGAGFDRLEGGAEGDRFYGGSSQDLASYVSASKAVTINLADPSKNLGDAFGDTFDSIEGLLGSAYGDRLYAGTNAAALHGGGGNDTLYGATGADALYGGEGNDVLSGQSGSDNLDGGGGYDWCDYSASRSGVMADLLTPSASTGEAAGDRFHAIEAWRGSTFADRIYGNMVSNRLDGGAGNDRLHGRAGADLLEGGQGADTLTGGIGADQFIIRQPSDGGDLVTDYNAADGDSLHLTFTGLLREDIQLRLVSQPGLGAALVAEAQILYRPTGQVLFTLQDGADMPDIFLHIGAVTYDLV